MIGYSDHLALSNAEITYQSRRNGKPESHTKDVEYVNDSMLIR